MAPKPRIMAAKTSNSLLPMRRFTNLSIILLLLARGSRWPGCWLASQFELGRQALELQAQLVQVARRQVDLAGAADIVLAGLADVFHGTGDLVHADHLLLAGGSDLQGHFAGFLDARAQGADRLAP